MKTETKSKKFTFKTERPTGKYKSFFDTYILIKLDGKIVGFFSGGESKTIGFHVVKDDILEDNNPNCVWMNKFIKKPSTDIQEVKEFLNNHFQEIINKFNLYKLED